MNLEREAADVRMDDDTDADDIILHPFDEDTVHLLKNNDPIVAGLFIDGSDEWGEGADIAIAKSKCLREIYILLKDGDLARLPHLWPGIGNNRSVETLKLVGEGIEYASTDVEILMKGAVAALLEDNDQLQCIEYDFGLSHEALCSISTVLSNYSKNKLKQIHISNSCGFDQFEAEFFDSLKEIHSLIELSCTCFVLESMGCKALANLLQNRASNITTLTLEYTGIDDISITILSNAFIKNNEIGTRNRLSTLTIFGDISVTESGWRMLWAFLVHDACQLENLHLIETSVADDELIRLGAALSVNQSVKHLDVSFSVYRGLTRGWAGFSTCLRSPRSVLVELNLSHCSISIDGMIEIMLALAENSRLAILDICYMHDDVRFSERFWQQVVTLLCDTTSINNTFLSNHILHTLKRYGYRDPPQPMVGSKEVVPLLQMNMNANKTEVARQKILSSHFSRGVTNVQTFANMQERMLPYAIEWIGRDNLGFSLMFSVVQDLLAVNRIYS